MNAPLVIGADGSHIIGTTLLPASERPLRIPRRANARDYWRSISQVLGRFPPSSWLMIDSLTIVIAVQIAFQVFDLVSPEETPHISAWQAMGIFPFATVIASLVFGLYEREILLSRSRILARILLVVALSAVLAYAIVYVLMYETVSRRVAGLTLSMFLVVGGGFRFVAWWALRRLRRGLLVVGPRSLYESFASAQSEGFLHEYQLVGYAGANGERRDSLCAGQERIEATRQQENEAAMPPSLLRRGQGEVSNPLVPPFVKGGDNDDDPFFLGAIDEHLNDLRRLAVSDIVVGRGVGREADAMRWIVPSLQSGCRVTDEATFYEKATGQIFVDGLNADWFLFADLKVHCEERATLKRLIDLLTTTAALTLSAPLWPLIALAVKLCDGGPVFYSQERVGQHGRIFRLYKFRTMRVDAENGKSVWSSPNDPRITTVGKILRRTRLDELPQLFNVLLGQMSIVGPRPERPDIVDQLREHIPYYAERHLVKPGITGWAQISFRYGSSIEDAIRKLRFDLYYLKHMSLELDMMIFFRTAGTFLRGAC